MTCPAPERLAEVAGGDVPAALADHVAACRRCASTLDGQRATRALLAGLAAPPPPSRSTRAQMAAEVMARADQLDDAPPARTHRGWFAAALVAAAVAAIAVVSLSSPRAPIAQVPRTPRYDVPPGTTYPAVPRTSPDPVPVPDPVIATIAPAKIEGRAKFERADRAGRDIVTLRTGAITVDAREARPVEIAIGATRVNVGEARVRVVAKGGVIESVTVIAGSAEVVHEGHRAVIETGELWEAPQSPATQAPATAAPHTSDALHPSEPPADAVSPFREGWIALRAGRNDDAIAAFDRATDAAVVEDAAYWASIACIRAGHTAEARRRLAAFAERFPDSPRIGTLPSP